MSRSNGVHFAPRAVREFFDGRPGEPTHAFPDLTDEDLERLKAEVLAEDVKPIARDFVARVWKNLDPRKSRGPLRAMITERLRGRGRS